jgi:putative flippase GtrA
LRGLSLEDLAEFDKKLKTLMNTQSFGKLKEGLTFNRGASLIEIFKQVFSFSIVGVFNTFLGHGTIFSLMFFFKVSPEVSNMIGYSVALINSFFMNKFLVFKGSSRIGKEALLFLFTFLISYSANFLTLKLLINLINPYICQIVAAFVYTFTSFFLYKFLVFKC